MSQFWKIHPRAAKFFGAAEKMFFLGGADFGVDNLDTLDTLEIIELFSEIPWPRLGTLWDNLGTA